MACSPTKHFLLEHKENFLGFLEESVELIRENATLGF